MQRRNLRMTTHAEHGDSERGPRPQESRRPATTTPKPAYDFIVCGAGASGSVIARRLAENADVQVLLIEAGSDDEAETVLDPAAWPVNLGSERDWGFQAQPNPQLN